MLDVIANCKCEAIRNSIVRVRGLERLCGVVFLDPAGTQRMQAYAGDGRKDHEEDRGHAETLIDKGNSGTIDNPIGEHPFELVALRNAIGVKRGAQRLYDEEEGEPDGLAQR